MHKICLQVKVRSEPPSQVFLPEFLKVWRWRCQRKEQVSDHKLDFGHVDPEIIKIEMSRHGDTVCIGEQKGLEAKEGGRIGDIKKVSVG